MKSNKIIITTGDVDGIGFEVTAKALSTIKLNKNFDYIVYANNKNESQYFNLLKRNFKIVEFADLASAVKYRTDSNELVQVNTAHTPAQNVEEAAVYANQSHNVGIVTAPLSKPEIIRAGLKDLGHTDILKRVSGVPHTFMTFLGKHFNVTLNTGHIPLSQVARTLSEDLLVAHINLIKNDLIDKGVVSQKPIGLLGLNPHAGDAGLIGSEETLLKNVMQKLSSRISLVGPLVPDAAFVGQIRDRVSIFLALYHDQGLIPFKLAHGYDSGVHLTLGIPFIRTSVDHGTAKDIFGQDRANASSMREAILKCIQIMENKNV